LILILIVAGVLSFGISLYEYFGLHEGGGVFFEPAGIFIAIILATGLSFYFEAKADKEFALLNQVSDDEPVTVIRNGHPTQITRREVVVGDTVMLNTGDEIPADGHLVEATLLNVDESTLTGEPICHKTVIEEEFDPDATFPSDSVMRGTKVMEGHGVMTVTAVGDATENGKVYEAAQITDNTKTPLDEQFERLGRLISIASYIIGALIIVGRVTVYLLRADAAIDWMAFGAYMLQSVMIAVTLVVCSVPEGLPMAVTLALAYSMRRMLKTNNLVRKMHACETMGATTVICTDKTGTLTQNRMQVAEVKAFGDATLLQENMAVNSTAQLDLSGDTPSVLGNPTEGALLLWLRASGTDYRQLRSQAVTLDEVPFSTERKYMATVVKNPDGKVYLFVKGAPEIVYAMSADTPIDKTALDTLLLGYQNQAMRTLGFACAEVPDGQKVDTADLKSCRLTFQGVVAISDPVRTEVPGAVREAINAGIKIKIVTGDTPATAREIGRQVGLWNDSTDTARNIITGPEFAALTDEELVDRVEDMK
ncbi:MAG: HAD-IC family P-type ATPase, partial [Muribaculaceae bacterium]|nr:HAD-IC family P-type ATPase [Muribaculaceae bacterium]